MKIEEILAEVSRDRGLTVRPDGSVIGTVSSFPVLIRSVPHGNVNAVYFTLRTGAGDFAALKTAVKGAEGLKASMIKALGNGYGLQYVLPYSIFFKGKVKAAVIALLDILMPLVAAHFSPPPAACEVCSRPGTEKLVVRGGMPVLLCPGCTETLQAKKETARLAYEATSPNYARGIIMGLIGAALGAVVWAAVILLFKSTYLVLAVGIGIVVAFFMKKAMGRVDRVGYVIAAVLVLASVFAGELLAYIWFIGKATGRLDASMAYHAYMNILLNNPDTLIFTLIFALAGVWIGVATLSRMEKEARDDDIS